MDLQELRFGTPCHNWNNWFCEAEGCKNVAAIVVGDRPCGSYYCENHAQPWPEGMTKKQKREFNLTLAQRNLA